MCCIAMALRGASLEKTYGDSNKNFSVRALDEKIVIRWPSFSKEVFSCVNVEITDGENIVQTANYPLHVTETFFTAGEHGKRYWIHVNAIRADGSEGQPGESFTKRTIFLDYDRFPDLPLMVINTDSGEDPPYTYLEPQDGQVGAAVTSNDYLRADMLLKGDEDVPSGSYGLRIRVRGNSSAIYNYKVGYKIHLDEAAALLGDGDIKTDEWVLLNNGNRIVTWVSDDVGDLCGMEWQPHMQYVNVLLNGDWKGCFALTPAVDIKNAGEYVDNSGYIFEADAYWWNYDGAWFRTENQDPMMGFTFKYPRMTDEEDPRLLQLKEYMQEFENYLIEGDERYRDYIDELSFARWILARDVLGTADGAGSNLYYYKESFDPEDPTGEKVKMGPLWDHDRVFETLGTWSHCRNEDVSYFYLLFGQPSFAELYKEEWKRVSASLMPEIRSLLAKLKDTKGEALDLSWQIEENRWEEEIPSLEEQCAQVESWFANRIIWMNNELGIAAPENTSLDASGYTIIKSGLAGEIEESSRSEDAYTLQGWIRPETYENGMRAGFLSGSRLYFANMEEIRDSEGQYPLLQYKICLSPDADGTVCLVDPYEYKIYR